MLLGSRTRVITTMPEAMTTDKLITILSLSQALEPAVDSVYEVAQQILSACTPYEPATKFDLQTVLWKVLPGSTRVIALD